MLEVLPGIFNRFVLQTNVTKVVGMVCQLYRISVRNLEVAYNWRITGVVSLYRVRQLERFQCIKCKNDLETRSFAAHRQTRNGIIRVLQW